MTEAMEIAALITGRAHRLHVAPRRVLADVLREDLQLLGCKIGCDQAVCGACTVLVDEMPVTACTTFAFEVGGSSPNSNADGGTRTCRLADRAAPRLSRRRARIHWLPVLVAQFLEEALPQCL